MSVNRQWLTPKEPGDEGDKGEGSMLQHWYQEKMREQPYNAIGATSTDFLVQKDAKDDKQ
jgi:hypothetical protein